MVKLNTQIQWETLDAQIALKGSESEPAIYHCTPPESSEKLLCTVTTKSHRTLPTKAINTKQKLQHSE